MPISGTRTRTRGDILSAPITYLVTRGDGTSYSGLVGGYTYGTKEEMTDVVQPKGTARLARGEVLNNPMSKISVTRSRTAGSWSQTATTWSLGDIASSWTGMHVDEVFPLDDVMYDFNHLITQAATACIANIEPPEAQALPFIGELRQTVASLRNPLKHARSFLDAYQYGKKIRLNDGKKTRLINGRKFRKVDGDKIRPDKGKARADLAAAKALANQHLEIVFGLLPVIHDISQAIKALRDGPKHFVRETARGYASDTDSIKTSMPWTDGARVGTSTYEHIRNVNIRAYALYEVEFVSFAKRMGFDWVELPAAAVELTPFSFVVNWFVNLDELIRSLQPKVGVNILSQGYTITTVDAHSRALNDVTLNIPGWVGSGGGEVRAQTRIETSRVPADLGNHRGIVLRPRLGVSQLLSSTSLIIQRLKVLDHKIAK